MKIKFLLSLFVAGTLAVGAQTQGYKDGIEYYKAGQHDNARTILERTINDPATAPWPTTTSDRLLSFKATKPRPALISMPDSLRMQNAPSTM